MHVFRLDENLGRGAPTGHEPRNLLRFAEILNVVFQLQCQFVLVLRLFDVSSVEPLYVFAVERRFHRLDGFQERLHFLQVLIIQNAGFFRGLVRIILEKIPASKNQVIEVCQRNQLLNQRRVVVGALAKTNRSELSKRPYRLGFSFADQLHAGHQRRAYRAHSGQQHSQFSFGRRNLSRLFHSAPSSRRPQRGP